jgi:hypothetical protein
MIAEAYGKGGYPMTLTPTAQSSAIAGFALWLVGWATLFKIDKIPFVGRFVNKTRVINWILDNKVLTLLCTEIFNFGVHGISNPSAVTFALGGTVFNALMVFLLLPIGNIRGRKSNAQVLQGHV